jgi:hypothetical protein
MSTPSHDPASLVKAISDVLTPALGNVLTGDLAAALAARISRVVPVGEAEALRMLTIERWAGLPLTRDAVQDRARNIAVVASAAFEDAA